MYISQDSRSLNLRDYVIVFLNSSRHSSAGQLELLEMTAYGLSLCATLVITCCYLLCSWEAVRRQRYPTGPLSLPIVGNLWIIHKLNVAPERHFNTSVLDTVIFVCSGMVPRPRCSLIALLLSTSCSIKKVLLHTNITPT